MPPPSTAQQKVFIAQFVSLTGASERQATRYLKSTGFKINEAVDAFYAAGNEPKTSALETKLDGLFDSLRDDGNDEKNKLELESTMEYLSNKLKVSIENAELFIALELVQAPSVGEITRKGYVDGWKATGVGATHQEHAAHIRKLKSSLSTDTALFKKVYRYTFVAGRERDQKALSLENAMIYWSILFSPPGMSWETANHDWLELWKSFLNEKWTRSVNKDMWNMTLEFALKAMADETLSFWNEDGAWPSVIDDFVEWCRVKGITKSESMDVDADA
ncbi:defective in cullin neddylation protein 1 [Purpureocillium lilacinum]|uniref:Defective in cullin neddylation protein n=1 Tax=Purpureocillium lilacinum TaxID=33203 RepID=A0A179HV04_PURLI|nr:defective in cullin neddylation protein 1 [Purpureocillium lilacinum]OAQ78969.1 defective in cullin neddylation protein 1 [Purpureocillium lilacinum]OAQ93279.1 defective in cullin neddylation protein 1 [Purpureocillium lilacinum]GJN71739.1 scaffold-type E3 ligase [Purpureocillium lilacinum]GJN82387.1 scaffold-type E3 ligase [Purpureocillium lilacinum]